MSSSNKSGPTNPHELHQLMKMRICPHEWHQDSKGRSQSGGNHSWCCRGWQQSCRPRQISLARSDDLYHGRYPGPIIPSTVCHRQTPGAWTPPRPSVEWREMYWVGALPPQSHSPEQLPAVPGAPGCYGHPRSAPEAGHFHTEAEIP